MTYQEAAQEAIDVQSACNLSGVVRSFAKIMLLLWDEAHSKNMATNWVNTHPICRLFAEQIAHLSGAGICSDGAKDYHSAHAECEKIANS